MNFIFVFVFLLVPLTGGAMLQPHEKLLEFHQLVFVKAFLNEKFKANYERTGFADRNVLGFDGIKIPVFVYSLTDSSPTDTIAGCILKNARPTLLAGLWTHENAVPINRVFLKTPEHDNFRAQILARSNDVIFRASSLIIPKSTTQSILAVLWADQGDTKKLFLTLTDLGSLDNADPIIDLDKNREEITLR